MKANETKVDKFLATNETTFAIPVFQIGVCAGLTVLPPEIPPLSQAANRWTQLTHYIRYRRSVASLNSKKT